MPFPSFTQNRTSIRRSLVCVVVFSLLLAGCTGGSSNEDPEPTAIPTDSPIPTLAADQTSVGQLLDKIDAAWPSVKSMRATSWAGSMSSEPTSIGTPEANEMVTVEDAIAPSTRRLVSSIAGAPIDEQIAIDGVVYFKGTSVVDVVAPFLGTTTWVEVDPAIVPADSPVGQRLVYLTGPLTPPYGMVSDDLRERGATPSGQITIEGRSCTVFTFVDTTSSGSAIDYAISLDQAGLPCSLVQSAGGYANFTTYAFNDASITITAPADVTSVSGTPEG